MPLPPEPRDRSARREEPPEEPPDEPPREPSEEPRDDEPRSIDGRRSGACRDPADGASERGRGAWRGSYRGSLRVDGGDEGRS